MQLLLSNINIESVTCLSESRRVSEISSSLSWFSLSLTLLVMIETSLFSSF